MMSKRVLFVDDEPAILGIYKLLGPFIGEDCSVATASSGQEALRLMELQTFDVLVSDLTMPSMSGLELLAEAADRFPATGRIVVSGFTDEITAAKCHILAHRYYTKPFSPVVLSTEIASLCEARNFAANNRVRQYVGKINALPTVSGTYRKLTKALQSNSVPMQEVSEIVARDIALTAKVLQIVNAAKLAPARRITSVLEAVQLIGLGVVRALAVSTQLFEFCHEVVETDLYRSVWAHSVEMAIAARRVACIEELPADDCDEAFLIGLLHDIGKVVLAASCAEYHAMWKEHRNDSKRLVQFELEAFGADHAHVGSYLLRLWGLPESAVEAIRVHHSFVPDDCVAFNPLRALHAAHRPDG
jgi:HD-like signal output (HDOD) protein/ActR/RegA family two-component response regulator